MVFICDKLNLKAIKKLKYDVYQLQFYSGTQFLKYGWS